MRNDKRKSQRRSMRYTAWVSLEGEELHGCVLSDISDHGARLDVEKAEKLPDRFSLLLSARGTPRRDCRVVWRAPNQIGVQFEKHLSHAETVSLVPKPDADTVAALTSGQPVETD